ncbi:phosphoenolpyruvate--protein phosphotransferase, partial [bacterium]|nr:phosphoenolpyruvate--protein phosphotransferase [bacterium]
YIDMFYASSNQLIQEKTEDIKDLLTRLLSNLLSEEEAVNNYFNRIIIAKSFYPSDILKMSSEDVWGIVLTSGGVTSHLSILARSLHIPMVIVDRPEFLDIPDDVQILLDAELGNIYLNPDDDIIREFEKQKAIQENILKDKDFLKKPVVTSDGTRINLLSNINLLSDLKLARESYSDGIGLYRTEFPFLIRTDFPSEEEQYVIYSKLVAGMPNKPITFRTLDIGGDKLLTYGAIKEQNPFLGFRSIRFSLQYKEVFVQQIRAILRASVKADLRIMFPMISSIDEFLEAKEILRSCQAELKKENISYHHNPKIGIMVEVPSIINILNEIAQEVDFFSIGTNDLIQFVLAVDRTNEKIADLYNPVHPSILRTLKKIVEIAEENKIDISLCGDMAHNERYIPF